MKHVKIQEKMHETSSRGKKMNGFLVKPHIYCPNITETVIKKNERFTFKTMVKNNIETSWAIGRALGQDRFLYCNYSLLF